MLELYDYQHDALNALWDFWTREPLGHPVIVAPTGSGKSVMIAALVRKVLESRPHYRILCVTHRKEIIEQNARELQGLMPTEAVGVYSNMLKRKEVKRVTFAAIQSIYKKTIEGVRLIIIDEAHLLPRNEDSMYQKFLRRHVGAKMVGFTATPFRLDQGSLVGGDNLFSEICYDIGIVRLIEKGVLARPVSKVKQGVDISGVSKSGWDYKTSELESLFCPVVANHCKQIIEAGQDRKHWLIFCSGVRHAEMVAAALKEVGVRANCVHGGLLPMDRGRAINEFCAGEVRALTNCDVLTTGFNFKPIDMVVLLRATASASLYIQMVGRGMRGMEGKKDVLILDFGSNISKHGPIDLITIRDKKQGKGLGHAPFKICPACSATNPPRAQECIFCLTAFPVNIKLCQNADDSEILSTKESGRWMEVEGQEVKIHKKDGKPDSLKIVYDLGRGFTVAEYMCFDHGGWASAKARQLWKELGGKGVPNGTLDASMKRGELNKIGRVRIIKDDKYHRVIEREVLKWEESKDEIDEILQDCGLF